MTGAVGLRVDCDRSHASAAREEDSRDKLRYVRPGDSNTPLKRVLYDNEGDEEDEDQGELFPIDADDDAYAWDKNKTTV